MRLSELEKIAKDKGIKNTWKYLKEDLIHEIQRKEGNIQCFGTARGNSCSQLNCCWRSDCLK